MTTGYEGYTFAELERMARAENNKLAMEIFARTEIIGGGWLLDQCRRHRSKQFTKYKEEQPNG